jgi:putative membrane protein
MVLKRIFFVSANLIPLTFFACTQGPGGPMGGTGRMMGCAYGGGFMWLIVLVLVGGGIYFLLQTIKKKDGAGSMVDTPLEILNKRYAKGEIEKEEFDRKKKDLES